MKKCLNIKIPPLTGYLEEAHPLSIVECYDAAKEWLYSNYITLVYGNPLNNGDQPLKFFKLTIDGIGWCYKLPCLYYFDVDKQSLRHFGVNIIEYIVNEIDQNKYVLLNVDEYYTSFSVFYKSEHYLHALFIYGYDTDENIFHIMAYDKKTMHYENTIVSFSEMRAALQWKHSLGLYDNLITSLSYNPLFQYNFNVDLVLESLESYLSSENSLDKPNLIFHNKNKSCFGLAIYDHMKEYCKVSENIIPFQILLEHKAFMLRRVRYMMNNQYIEEDASLLKDIEELVEKAKIIKTLKMKHIISKSDKIIEKIVSHLEDLKTKERDSFIKLIERLEASYIKEKGEKQILYSGVGKWPESAVKIRRADENHYNLNVDIIAINNNAVGFIGLVDDNTIRDYKLSWSLTIDTIKNMVGVGRENNIVKKWKFDLKQCSKVHLELEIDIKMQTFTMCVNHNEVKDVYSGPLFYPLKNDEDINFLIIHENGERFKIHML